VIAVVFNVLSEGIFLSPENLYNIAQQTAVVGILATVMVLIIVARHIDLSVGSVMGFVGVLIAFLIYTANWSWQAACLMGLAAAIAVSMYQGALTAFVGVPSFVVTLGGLMSFRGAAYLVADGKTQPLADPFFLKLGGGYNGGIGTTASWILAALLCCGLLLAMLNKRRAKKIYGVPTNPAWVDLVLVLIPVAIVLAFVATMNAYHIPNKDAPQGVPIPVLIWGAVALVISFLVHRTRFGRYIFAIGGKSGCGSAGRYSGAPGDDALVPAFGGVDHDCRHRGHLAPERGHQFAGQQPGAAGDCGYRDRRHRSGRWQRHHHRLGAGRAHHAMH